MFNIPTQRLAKVTVTEVTSAVTLSVNPIVIAALSFTPRHLVVRTNVQATTGTPNMFVNFNGDTGSNYDIQALEGYSSSLLAFRGNAAYLNLTDAIPSTSNVFSSDETLLPDALSTRSHKSVLSFNGRVEANVRVAAGRWASTAAITSITLYTSAEAFAAGSTFELCVVDESFNIDQDGDGEQILGSDGTFSVGSISAADGDLVCIGNVRGARSGAAENLRLSFNGVTSGTPFPSQLLYGSSTTAAALALDTLPGYVGEGISGNTATTGAFGGFVSQVTNFSDGSNHRVATTLCGHDQTGVSVSSMEWEAATAISSLKFEGGNTANFLTGSMLSTYAVPKNLITRTELGSAAASVTFSSIPQTYDHLEVSWYSNSDEDVTALRGVSTTFNGDTGTNYAAQVLEGTGSSIGAASLTGQTDMPFAALTQGTGGAANEMSGGSFTVQNYTKTDRHKHLLAAYGVPAQRLHFGSNRWASTAAVTSITLTQDGSGDFITGSVFTLRGIHSTVAAAATDIETINGIAAANIEAVN